MKLTALPAISRIVIGALSVAAFCSLLISAAFFTSYITSAAGQAYMKFRAARFAWNNGNNHVDFDQYYFYYEVVPSVSDKRNKSPYVLDHTTKVLEDTADVPEELENYKQSFFYHDATRGQFPKFEFSDANPDIAQQEPFCAHLWYHTKDNEKKYGQMTDVIAQDKCDS